MLVSVIRYCHQLGHIRAHIMACTCTCTSSCNSLHFPFLSFPSPPHVLQSPNPTTLGLAKRKSTKLTLTLLPTTSFLHCGSSAFLPHLPFPIAHPETQAAAHHCSWKAIDLPWRRLKTTKSPRSRTSRSPPRTAAVRALTARALQPQRGRLRMALCSSLSRPVIPGTHWYVQLHSTQPYRDDSTSKKWSV